MKKAFFTILAAFNRKVLPRYSRRNLAQLDRLDKILIAWRYWVTKNAL